jgi:hypothetical protein
MLRSDLVFNRDRKLSVSLCVFVRRFNKHWPFLHRAVSPNIQNRNGRTLLPAISSHNACVLLRVTHWTRLQHQIVSRTVLHPVEGEYRIDFANYSNPLSFEPNCFYIPGITWIKSNSWNCLQAVQSRSHIVVTRLVDEFKAPESHVVRFAGTHI